jgi:RNA polymerase sigma factor (sigma-70 family)
VTERQIAEAIRSGRKVAAQRDIGPLMQAYVQLTRLLKSKFSTYFKAAAGSEAGEDLLQELFLLVIMALEEDRIEDPDALVSYARGMARNLRAKAIERQATRMRREIEPGENLKAPGVSPEAEAISRHEAAELAGIFQSLLGELDDIDREIVLRFYFRAQDAETIQGELGITREVFRVRKSRAVQRLQSMYKRTERLSPENEPPPAA